MKEKIEQMTNLSKELRTLFSENDILQRHCIKIGRMECNLLHFLYRIEKPICMNDLAEYLGVSHSRVTRIVDNLVKKELVKRYPSSQDRRRWFTEITEDGKTRATSAKSEMQAQQEQIYNNIPSDKRDFVLEGLDIFLEAFRKTIIQNEVKNET